MKMSFRLLLTFGLIGALTYGFLLFSQSQQETVSSSEEVGKITLPSELLDAAGSSVSSDQLKGKYIGLYFSASWCGPCRQFTPQLVSFRNNNIERFEVILVGADGSPQAQQSYMKKYNMPWLAVENQSKVSKTISKIINVESLPTLIILDSDGKIISRKGQDDILEKGDETVSYWQNLSE